MTRHTPERIIAALEDLERFCLENSMHQSRQAIIFAIQKANSETRSEMLDAAIAVSAANAMKSMACCE